ANIAAIQQQIDALNSLENTVVTNEFAIRKKLPDNRSIEQLLLNIEEMEYVTGSRITSISFNNYDALVSGSGFADPNAPKIDETTQDPNAQTTETTTTATTTSQEPTNTTETTTTETTTTESTETDTTEMPISSIDVTALPTNLKMITFNLEVEAPNEKSLMSFIKEIEKLERIMNVENVEFSLPGEENSYTPDASDIVSTTVQVTTFYYE
ncbi:MAG: potassium transporter, partial [Lysinibacillus sp.]